MTQQILAVIVLEAEVTQGGPLQIEERRVKEHAIPWNFLCALLSPLANFYSSDKISLDIRPYRKPAVVLLPPLV